MSFGLVRTLVTDMPAGRPTPAIAKARGEVAGLSRSRAENDPEYIAARQRLKEANFQEYINRTVNTFPQLQKAQIDRLAGLIRPIREDATPMTKATKVAAKARNGGVNEAG